MYTHNPPEQFSLVTRAESTCVERLFRALLGGVLSPGGTRPPRRARCGRRSVRNSCLDVSCFDDPPLRHSIQIRVGFGGGSKSLEAGE